MKPSGTNNLTPNISLASTFYIAKTTELWAITYSTTPPYIRPQPVCFPNSTRNVSSAVFATHEQEICEKDVENRFYFQEGLELELVWENSYFKGGDGDFAAFCVKEEKDGCVLMVEKDAGRLRGCEVVDIFVLPISD